MTPEAGPVAAGDDTTISTSVLLRIVVGLIAVWTLIAGIVLIGFQGATSGALGAGLVDEAAQRLLGAHLLVLVPAYLLLVFRLERYRGLLWLPFGAQLAAAGAVAYSIINGETKFGDGVLAVVVSGILASLLAFVWITEQRSVALQKFRREELGPTTLDEP